MIGAYISAEKHQFISTTASNIVFYLFIAVFFTVYLTLGGISMYRQVKKPQIFSRSMVTVRLSLIDEHLTQ